MANLPLHPGEALWIGGQGGQNHYNVGIGQGTSGGDNHEDFGQSAIADGYTDPQKFFLNAAGNVVFRINASAGRTSRNTAHPRSELRELLLNGSSKAAWDGRSGVHYAKGRCRIIEVTNNRPWICFAQIHGSDGSPITSDLLRLQTEGANGTTTGLAIVARRSPVNGGSEIRTVLKSGYSVGTWFSWEIRCEGGKVKVLIDGQTVLDVADLQQNLNYFKAGCYLQDNVEKGASPTSWGAVEYERGSFVTWHTGTPLPTKPVFTGPNDPGGGPGGGDGTADTQAPSTPRNGRAVRGNNQLALSWDASTDNVGVAGYKVYRFNPGGGGGGGGGGTEFTVGRATSGSSETLSSTDKMAASSAVAGSSGKLIAGRFRAWLSAAGSTLSKMAVYADASGAPGARLAVSDEITISTTSEGERAYPFSGANQINLVQGTTYWIAAAWDDPGTPSITYSRAGTTNGRVESTATYGTPPNPFGTPSGTFSGPIDAWLVAVTGTSGGAAAGYELLANAPTTSYLATGLTNGVQYDHAVTALDAAGNESARSDAIIGVPGPPDVTAPTVPTGLGVVPGDRRCTLNWNASVDTDSGLRRYTVYADGTLFAEVDAPTVALIAGGLSNGRAYSWQVSATDRSGNESARSAAVVATPAAPAIGGVPLLPKSLPGGKIEVAIAWGADLTADEATWAWTDVTGDVRVNPGISTSLGRNDESSSSNPADLTVELDNSRGDYSLGGRSVNWPHVRRNTPVRVRIDPGDGGGGRIVFQGGADGLTPGWDLTGRIPVVTLSASGTLRRLAQGSAPIAAAYRRATIPLTTVRAYWPLEEGQSATYGEVVRGGSRFTVTGSPDWASSTELLSSAPLPNLSGARLEATVNAYPSTGANQVRWLMALPDNGLPDGTVIAHVGFTGSIHRFDLTYEIVDDGSHCIGVYQYRASDGARVAEPTFIVFGQEILGGFAGRLSLEVRQSGSSVKWLVSLTPQGYLQSGTFLEATIPSHTCGIVDQIELNPQSAQAALVVGHVTVENAITSAFAEQVALSAYEGEYPVTAGGRLARLCVENGIPFQRYSGIGIVQNIERMGPQPLAPLLTLIRECEVVDQGQVWDGRSAGLVVTTRRRREEGFLALTVDASQGELAEPFDAVDDDQRTRNRVQVTRWRGVTVTREDVDGPLGTATVGIYDDSLTVNVRADSMAGQYAQWLIGLGTVEGYRYPSVTVDLVAAPHLAGDVLNVIPGDRVDVIRLDATLAEFPSPRVSLIVEGIAHEIGARTWRATFRCSPLEPWAIGEVAAPTGDISDMLLRPDTDGSSLTAAVAAGATSISVASVGPRWTTAADDFPLLLSVGGLRVRATACTGSASPQVMTVDPLPLPLPAGVPVRLWEPRRLGLG